ncbi:MAG: hypothetical protein AAFQ42_07645 [Pseudomonadota bacterium]
MASVYRDDDPYYPRRRRELRLVDPEARYEAYGSAHRGANPALLSRISWGSIIAGAITATAAMILLTLLGLGIGLAIVDPLYDQNPTSGAGIGTLLWIAGSSFLAMLVGGFVAGRFAGLPKTLSGALHGAVVWAIATLALVYLAGNTATSIVSGAATLVNQTASAAATAASGAAALTGDAVTAARSASPDQLPAPVRRALEREDATVADARSQLITQLNNAGLGRDDVRQATAAAATTAQDIIQTPGDAGADVQQFVDKLFGGSKAVISDQERQQFVQALRQRTGISQQEAERRLQAIERRLENARESVANAAQTAQQTALRAAETATNTASAVSWAAFVASLIGLIAAMFGATVGAPAQGRIADYDDDDDYDDRD